MAQEVFDLGDGSAVVSNPGGPFHGWLCQRAFGGGYVAVRKLSTLTPAEFSPFATPAEATAGEWPKDVNGCRVPRQKPDGRWTLTTSAEWFSLPAVLRHRWWTETDYARQIPKNDLARAITAALTGDK